MSTQPWSVYSYTPKTQRNFYGATACHFIALIPIITFFPDLFKPLPKHFQTALPKFTKSR
jgi:hypothetical protein